MNDGGRFFSLVHLPLFILCLLNHVFFFVYLMSFFYLHNNDVNVFLSRYGKILTRHVTDVNQSKLVKRRAGVRINLLQRTKN
jgi:cellulose synthase/poly-beta-1,6-N-acetylglucosamine synthase-like glycosyltransferase